MYSTMAKRFIDTAIFRKDFIRGLDAPCKLFWLYLINECDHAGLWDVEIEVAEIRLGVKLPKNAVEKFGGKIRPVDGGKKWFIPSFIDFQYGKLNPENRAHGAAISLLNKFNLLTDQNEIKPLTSPLQGAMDMDMVKELDTDKVKVKKAEPKKFDPLDYIPDGWINTTFLDEWIDFMAMRKRRKWSCTEKVLVDRINQLREFSNNDWSIALPIIRKSSERGYAEFFPINSHQTPKNGKPVRDKF